MTVSLKHAFASAKADGADSTLVQPSNWNAEHSLQLATNRLLGRTTAGTGAVEEISIAGALTLSGGVLTGTGGGSGGNLDGGTPTSNYGGITAIDGGTP
jgi:hypothetical protein